MEDKSEKISLPPNLLHQFRQLSIPLWARVTVLFLVLIVFLSDIALLATGIWQDQDKWLETATAIFGTTFAPTLLIAYLAFAETGVTALKRKTIELLDHTIPNSLRTMGDVLGQGSIDVEQISPVIESPTRRYRVKFTPERAVCNDYTEVFFSLDINVHKANLGLWIPTNNETEETDALLQKFCHTLDGAQREGYELNKHAIKKNADGQDYYVFVLVKKLTSDFLWDPGQKLYFSQDLRFFIASALQEGEQYFQRVEK